MQYYREHRKKQHEQGQADSMMGVATRLDDLFEDIWGQPLSEDTTVQVPEFIRCPGLTRSFSLHDDGVANTNSRPAEK